MDIEVKDVSGKTVKTIKLNPDIFEQQENEAVLHSIVKAYRANRRQGTHATKTRSMVSGGGKKPFKQKGRGTARQGSSRAPIHPGGATLHGPQPRDYSEKINKKMSRLALKIALSDKVRNKSLTVVDDFGVSQCSTKQITTMLKALGAEKALVADERKDHFLYRSTRNINGSDAVTASDINAENVLRYRHLVISENGINALTQRLGG